MPVAYNPTPIDFGMLAGIGQQLGQGYQRRRLAEEMKSAIGPDGTYDYNKMISVIMGRDPVLGAKLATDKAQADALGEYRAESLVPDSVREYEYATKQAQNIGSGDPTASAGQPASYMDFKSRRSQAALTAADRKAIRDADESVRAADTALANLEHASKINEKAFSGPLASQRGYVGSLLHGDAKLGKAREWHDAGVATQDLENTIIGNALAQLRAVFGGMPTEGERAILIQLQGSINATPEVRKQIFDKASEMVRQRKQFAIEQADELRGGTYYKPGGRPGSEMTLPSGGQPQQATSPGAPPIETPALQAEVAGGGYGKQPLTPAPDKIELLKQHANNPEARKAFDEIYGEGAAEFYLTRGR